MKFTVHLTADAERDLADLFDFIAANDAPAKAGHVLDKIAGMLDGLAAFPERGAFPKELAALGIREYREVFFKPYRILYRVSGKSVYVYLIADGRRDMRQLLERRLLGT
jgi:toxin ParE1/3/4